MPKNDAESEPVFFSAGMMFCLQVKCSVSASLVSSTCSPNTQVCYQIQRSWPPTRRRLLLLVCTFPVYIRGKPIKKKSLGIDFCVQCWMRPPALWRRRQKHSCTRPVNSWAWRWSAWDIAAAWWRYGVPRPVWNHKEGFVLRTWTKWKNEPRLLLEESFYWIVNLNLFRIVSPRTILQNDYATRC